MRKLFFWIFVSSVLCACGRDEASSLDTVASEEPLLRYADDPATVDEPQSYIVAYRHLLDDTRVHYASFASRTQAHVKAFVRSFARDLGFREPRYLASLNFADLGHSFDAPQPSFGPSFVQQKLQEDTGESIASIMEVTFKNDLEARTTLRQWLSEGRIYYAEPNGKSHLDGVEQDIRERFQNNQQVTPWLDQVSFLAAIDQMAVSPTKSATVVAVMDSGVDVEHPNLNAVIYRNTSGQNKLCKNDIYGCNTTVAIKDNLGDGNVYPAGTSGFSQSCGEQQSECVHGTHVSGIIAAQNAQDYVGMCPYCQILVVKVVDIETKGIKTSFVIKDSSIIAGLAYVSGFKVGGEPLVRVINASFGKFEKSRSVELFLKSLKTFGRGTLMVAAAGNEDTMRRQYPAGFDSVIAVSNVWSDTNDPQKSSSSNFGTWVDIAAPGDGFCGTGGYGIRSSVPGGDSRCKIGTSMASPVVAGIAALLLAKEPNLTASQVERRLLDTAAPERLYATAGNIAYVPNVKGLGRVPMLGAGVVDANLALNPSADTSLAVSIGRTELVKGGCGIVGGLAGATGTAAGSWLLIVLPILGISWHRRRSE